jgi:hypothetical protein
MNKRGSDDTLVWFVLGVLALAILISFIVLTKGFWTDKLELFTRLTT